MKRLVTTTYLEMSSQTELRRARAPSCSFVVGRAELPCPEINRFFYRAVGAGWQWHGRVGWDDQRWLAHVVREELQTWIGYVRGTPVGYFELESQDGNVEILYFGLLPRFIGEGIGGALLTRAIECAWGMGASRVWVHTCDLDHPQALSNYQSRGMRPYRVEQRLEEVEFPERATED